MKLWQWKMSTPVGPLYLVASDRSLLGIFWKKSSAPMIRSLSEKNSAATILRKTERQLEEYFSGRRREFSLPLETLGTEFQVSVWNQLEKIPYGKTCSYRDIAKKMKNDRAVRAVGTANGRNPFSIVVPCHRVIAADGTLGGYAGGLAVKKKLLALEKGD